MNFLTNKNYVCAFTHQLIYRLGCATLGDSWGPGFMTCLGWEDPYEPRVELYQDHSTPSKRGLLTLSEPGQNILGVFKPLQNYRFHFMNLNFQVFLRR